MDLATAYTRTLSRKAAPAPSVLGGYSPGKQVRASFDPDAAITDGYRKSTWVYACVQKISVAAASPEWRPEVWTAGDAWEEIEGPGLPQFMARPSRDRPWQYFVEIGSTSLLLTGNALFRVTRINARGEVGELIYMDPRKWRPRVDKAANTVTEYRRQDLRGQPIPADDVIHVMLPDPINQWWGLSPLMAAARAVDSDIAAVDWNRTTMETGAIVRGVLAFKDSLGAAQIQESRDVLRGMRAQGEDILIVDSDASFQKFGMSAAEMDFLNSRMFTLREICAVFGLDPALFAPDATYANKREARLGMWEDRVIPDLERFRQEFQRILLPAFRLDEQSNRMAYALESVPAFRQLTANRAGAFATYVGAGVPMNRAAESLGLPFGDLTDSETEHTPEPEVQAVPAKAASSPETKAISAGGTISSAEQEAIAKALDQELRSLVRRHSAAIAAAIAEAFAEAGSRVDVARLATLLAEGRTAEIILLLQLGRIDAAIAVAVEAVAAVQTAAGAATGTAIVKYRPGSTWAYQEALSRALEQAKVRMLEVAQQAAESTRRGILHIAEAFRDGKLGDDARLVAEEIAAFLGGNQTHARQLANLHARLLARQTEALRMRDLLLRYAERLRQDRARYIADNEAYGAMARGRVEAWDQAGRSEDFSGATILRYWQTAVDERVCPICLSLDGQERRAGEPYVSDYDGNSYSAPGDTHPDCRCGEIYLMVEV